MSAGPTQSRGGSMSRIARRSSQYAEAAARRAAVAVSGSGRRRRGSGGRHRRLKTGLGPVERVDARAVPARRDDVGRRPDDQRVVAAVGEEEADRRAHPDRRRGPAERTFVVDETADADRLVDRPCLGPADERGDRGRHGLDRVHRARDLLDIDPGTRDLMRHRRAPVPQAARSVDRDRALDRRVGHEPAVDEDPDDVVDLEAGAIERGGRAGRHGEADARAPPESCPGSIATLARMPSSPFGAFVRRWSSTRAPLPLGADGQRTSTTSSVPARAGSGDVTPMTASPTDTRIEKARPALLADAGPQQVGMLGDRDVDRHEVVGARGGCPSGPPGPRR